MNPNEAAGEGLSGRLRAEQGEEAAPEGQGSHGPQKGAWGISIVEEYHWDAAKSAEVARILAEHPPRDCTVTTTIGQPLTEPGQTDLDTARRLAVTFQTRIDAARDWARRNLPADQQTELLRVLRGDTSRGDS
ncbi:hypothetical protein [Streptomyces hydrogenans]|uniref:hypothetical protein n=1 Tax=Streptomyces hydrogenans TaxID=1873719 RepID=UPI0038232AFB